MFIALIYFFISSASSERDWEFQFPGFDVYERKSNELSFAYSPNEVCRVRRQQSGYYGSLAKVHSFENSATARLMNSGVEMVRGCFSYRGYSYFVTLDKRSGRTTFVRNGRLRTFHFPLIYSGMHYDHLKSTLYLSANEALYRVRLDELEKWWTVRDYLNSTLLRSLSALYVKVGNIPKNISDLMIVNGTSYFIVNGSIYTWEFGANSLLRIVNEIDEKIFTFLLFPHLRIENIPDCKKDCDRDHRQNARVFWLYLLYVSDILNLLILAYLVGLVRLVREKTRECLE